MISRKCTREVTAVHLALDWSWTNHHKWWKSSVSCPFVALTATALWPTWSFQAVISATTPCVLKLPLTDGQGLELIFISHTHVRPAAAASAVTAAAPVAAATLDAARIPAATAVSLQLQCCRSTLSKCYSWCHFDIPTGCAILYAHTFCFLFNLFKFFFTFKPHL